MQDYVGVSYYVAPIGFSEEITTALGVTKYEPNPVFSKSADLYPLPCGLSKYDIEGAERNQQILELLMDVPVVITEKLEGTNFSVTYSVEKQKVFVNQRSYTIVEKEGHEHSFWTVAKKLGLIDLVTKLAIDSSKTITIYGEFLGPSVQGNVYGLKEHTIRIFDVKVGLDFASWNHLDYLFVYLAKPELHVPVLCDGISLREWMYGTANANNPDPTLDGRHIASASNGPTSLECPNHMKILREGIVIKPVVEQNVERFGRLILKQRSPEYLAASKL